jgi:hypothetical protein
MDVVTSENYEQANNKMSKVETMQFIKRQFTQIQQGGHHGIGEKN